MRMRMTVHGTGAVTIAYDADGARVERTFTCPRQGGYVVEEFGSADWQQVCEGLTHRGVTLMAPSRDALPEVIRREYRKMRA